MPAYAWGYNGFGQVVPLQGSDSETSTSEPTLLEGCDEVCAASWSQTVGLGDGQYLLWGYDPDTDSCVSRKVLERDRIGASPIQSWLGKQHILATLDAEGRVCEISGRRRRTGPDYALGSMSGDGKVLLAQRRTSRALDDLASTPALETLEEPVLLERWDTLGDLLSPASSSDRPALSGCRRFTLSPRDTIVDIRAGAGHFAVQVSRLPPDDDHGLARLYTFGDNRYGQLGLPRTGKVYVDEPTLVPSSDSTSKPTEPFMRGSVACGDNFTILVTQTSGVVGFGINDQDQLGSGTDHAEGEGTSADGPTLLPAGAQRVLSQAGARTVTAVECGSSHSITIADGKCHAVGSDRWGQCAGDGTGGRIEVPGLEACLRAKGDGARVRVACGRWHTVLSYDG